jgi:hypothetical protein
MCVVKIEQVEVLGAVEPLSEECRTCRQRLRIDSNKDAGELGSTDSTGNEAQGIITISGCPQRTMYPALGGATRPPFV